jgi:hypothetical protein
LEFNKKLVFWVSEILTPYMRLQLCINSLFLQKQEIMETIVIHPKNKAELELLKTMLKKMSVKAKVVSESLEHRNLKEAMLKHSKDFFISKLE